MGCGCNKGKVQKYQWTSDPDPETGEVTVVEKVTEVEVRARVIRKGGTWKPVLA